MGADTRSTLRPVSDRSQNCFDSDNFGRRTSGPALNRIQDGFRATLSRTGSEPGQSTAAVGRPGRETPCPLPAGPALAAAFTVRWPPCRTQNRAGVLTGRGAGRRPTRAAIAIRWLWQRTCYDQVTITTT